MSLKEAMTALEKAGTAQARKTYTRHGAAEPMFGVSFGDLKKILNKIKIDQELAEALWDTGNFDARNLAAKVCDPANFPPKVLDAWAATPIAWTWGGYVGQIAAEGPPGSGKAKAEKWLRAKDEATRTAGWCTVSAMAMIEPPESTDDAWFTARLAEIEKGLTSASTPNRHRSVMNNALIAIGGRNAALRKAATAAAKRLGTIEIDHGDTDCKTPDAVERLEKTWDRSKSSGYESPAAQERDRESMRTRC
jgi:3-methyladenine DNA glycosylase AlkD